MLTQVVPNSQINTNKEVANKAAGGGCQLPVDRTRLPKEKPNHPIRNVQLFFPHQAQISFLQLFLAIKNRRR